MDHRLNFRENFIVQMASTLSSRNFLMIFKFLPGFVVSIVIRLIVMFYWLPMHDEQHSPPITAYLSVFIGFSWNLLNLLALTTLKNTFSRNCFEQ